MPFLYLAHNTAQVSGNALASGSCDDSCNRRLAPCRSRIIRSSQYPDDFPRRVSVMDLNTPLWLGIGVFIFSGLVGLAVFVLICRIGEQIRVPDDMGTPETTGKGCLSRIALLIALAVAAGVYWLLDRLIAYLDW